MHIQQLHVHVQNILNGKSLQAENNLMTCGQHRQASVQFNQDLPCLLDTESSIQTANTDIDHSFQIRHTV